LPKPNQKTITVRKDTYKVAETKAKKAKKTVAGFVTDLINTNCAEA
jgi:ribosomal protein S17E